MTTTYAKLVFWIVCGATLLVFAVTYYDKNIGGDATIRTCLQSTGGHYDPRSGDGPECERYGMETVHENKTRTVFRGIGEGLIPAVLLGLVGFWVGDKFDERKAKQHQKELERDIRNLLDHDFKDDNSRIDAFHEARELVTNSGLDHNKKSELLEYAKKRLKIKS